MGVPGWPELACCTASMDSVRMVLTHSWSMGLATAAGPRLPGAFVPEAGAEATALDMVSSRGCETRPDSKGTGDHDNAPAGGRPNEKTVSPRPQGALSSAPSGRGETGKQSRVTSQSAVPPCRRPSCPPAA